MPLVARSPSNIRIDFAGDTSTLEGRLETSQARFDLAGDAQWRDMAHPTANVHASGSGILITVPPYAKVTASPDVSLCGLVRARDAQRQDRGARRADHGGGSSRHSHGRLV